MPTQGGEREVAIVASTSKISAGLGLIKVDLEELTSKDPLGALELMMHSRGSCDKASSISTTSESDFGQ
ncbi:hypothetical protein TSUD_29850 [Trifolium subterraneum]|uniref:Uncharacterized protein n=1 Tax=Trifolium subterraneum TaxID=3900 RepID=A0A2Z6MBT3_TRISU|nr:hypothetical protein TSUD_29850 [Trifolium subterraneum]